MVTMADIASKVGVSRTAVSSVLNGRSQDNVRISEPTRRHILEVAESMGYRTNQLARAVALGKTRMIGYLVSEPRYEPYWNLIVATLNAAEESGFTLKVMSITGHTLAERVRQCTELRLGGLIVRVNGDKSLIYEEANRARIPVVVVDEGVPQPFGTRVTSDDAVGVQGVLDHLTQLGHRRIGFISSGFPQLSDSNGVGDVGTAREHLFRQEMAARGLEVPDGYITSETVLVYNPVDRDRIDSSSAQAATNALLNHAAGRPTAIFCWRDETALFAARECHGQGLRIPEDISIVGFTDISAARTFDPPLSTVQMPWDELGRMAIQQLMQRMDEDFDASPTTHLVATGFVARDSSGPALM